LQDTNATIASAVEITRTKTLSGLIGKIRPFIRLNGNGQNIEIPNTTGINVTTNDFALDWHGRPFDLSGTQWLCDRVDTLKEYGMYLNGSDLWIKMETPADSLAVKIADDICSVHDDVYIIVNFDRSGNATAYVKLNDDDFTEAGSTDITAVVDTLSSTTEMMVGIAASGSAASSFHGRIYSFRMWSRLTTSSERDNAALGVLPSSGVSIELTHDGLDAVGNDWHSNIDLVDATVTGVFMNTPTGSDRGFWLAEFTEIDKRYYFTYINSNTDTGRAGTDALIGQIVPGRIFTFNGMVPTGGFSGVVEYPGIIVDESLAGVVQAEKAFGRRPTWTLQFQVSTRKQFEDLQTMLEMLDGSLFPFWVCFNYDSPTPVVWRVRVASGIDWNYNHGVQQPWNPSISLVADI
jgi:hypothetical protein